MSKIQGGMSPARRRVLERQRKKLKRRRQLAVLLGIAVLAAIMFWLGRKTAGAPEQEVLSRYNRGEKDMVTAGDASPVAPAVNAESDKTWVVDSRRVLSDLETEQKLALLAAEDKEIAAIYAERERYPEELLTALANNPEMIDFAAGYPDAEKAVNGGFTESELSEEFPLLLQWDSRWGYAPYGDSCIGIAGCAPTCLSMVILSLTHNEEATPDKIADYSMAYGHYVEGVGTSWTLLTEAAEAYGVGAREMGLDEAEIKAFLDNDGLIICSMRPGDFTTQGHFIVICGYDKNGFFIKDPNSMERTDRQWTYEEIWYQIKNLWGYSLNFKKREVILYGGPYRK